MDITNRDNFDEWCLMVTRELYWGTVCGNKKYVCPTFYSWNWPHKATSNRAFQKMELIWKIGWLAGLPPIKIQICLQGEMLDRKTLRAQRMSLIFRFSKTWYEIADSSQILGTTKSNIFTKTRQDLRGSLRSSMILNQTQRGQLEHKSLDFYWAPKKGISNDHRHHLGNKGTRIPWCWKFHFW